jgi:hypothetical protein
MRRLLVLIISLFLNSTFAFADCSTDDQLQFKSYNLRVENDYFNGTDNNYTSGISLSGVTHDLKGDTSVQCLPTITQFNTKLLTFLDNDILKEQNGISKNMYFNLQQRMYTPTDVKTSTLITNDRPYAGIVELAVGVNERKIDHASSTQVLDTKELTLGVIGPASLAKQTQNYWHTALGTFHSYGWDHQLTTEPALMYAYERKIKTDLEQNSYTPGMSKDLIKYYGFNVGNISTAAHIGIEGRYGLNIPNDFGSDGNYPGCDNSAPTNSKSEICTDKGDLIKQIPQGAHAFAIAELTGVAYDFSLDGNMFSNDSHVHKNPAVGKLVVGVSSLVPMNNNRNLKLVLMQVIQTKEFEEQKKKHDYVSFNVGMDF